MYGTHYKLEITYAKRSSVLRHLAVLVSQYKTRHNTKQNMEQDITLVIITDH